MAEKSGIAARLAAIALVVALAIAAHLAWRIVHAPPAKAVPIAPARPPG